MRCPQSELSRRLTYLAGRFAPHAPRWELVLWAWQAALLGVVVFLDRDLAVVDEARLPFALRHVLDQRGIRTVALPPSDELRIARGMNMVVTAPRQVVMPADCPDIRAALESVGVTCRPVDVSAFLVAGGAMGCMTAILRRERAHSVPR